MAWQMSQVYKKSFTVHFREADPAGIMFFGNIYGIYHDAFEDMISSIGIGWQSYFGTKDYLIPLIKSEAEYRGPLKPGQSYEIHLSFSMIKTSSFEVTGSVLDPSSADQKPLLIVKTVHVCLDAQTKAKTSLPSSWEKIFRSYSSEKD